MLSISSSLCDQAVTGKTVRDKNVRAKIDWENICIDLSMVNLLFLHVLQGWCRTQVKPYPHQNFRSARRYTHHSALHPGCHPITVLLLHSVLQKHKLMKPFLILIDTPLQHCAYFAAGRLTCVRVR
jgi:hypothetical protein